jgi:fluoroacetyl-CoA thioesterase
MSWHLKPFESEMMYVEYNLQEGLKWTMEMIVGENDTASRYASGNIDVYATPAMIALMENTAKTCIDKYLPDGHTTVGIEVNVKHIKATPVGMKVKCEATLTKIQGKRLHFNVEAWDEQGNIGGGSHSRYIINTEEFMRKLQNV